MSIDAEKQPAVARRYHVAGYPDIRFVKSDGSQVHKIGGYVPLARFLQEMETARRAGGL